MSNPKILISITPELLQAIDEARRDDPRGPWLEAQLWTVPQVRRAAALLGLERPERLRDGRGRCRGDS